jgi:hypothetical protein
MAERRDLHVGVDAENVADGNLLVGDEAQQGVGSGVDLISHDD